MNNSTRTIISLANSRFEDLKTFLENSSTTTASLIDQLRFHLDYVNETAEEIIEEILSAYEPVLEGSDVENIEEDLSDAIEYLSDLSLDLYSTNDIIDEVQELRETLITEDLEVIISNLVDAVGDDEVVDPPRPPRNW